MKYIIAGRTGRGKDRLIHRLTTVYGWKFAKSSTTRPRRSETDDSYHFLTKNQAAAIPESEKMFRTQIGENEYFMTKDERDNHNAFVLTPDGIEQMIQDLPDECFCIVYLMADTETAREHAIKRGDPELEAKRFDIRSKDEDAVFSQFEKDIKDNKIDNERVLVIRFTNNFEESFLEDAAATLDLAERFFPNIEQIIIDLIQTGAINTDHNGNPQVLFDDKPTGITKTQLALYMYRKVLNKDWPSVTELLLRWLTLPDLTIHAAPTPNLLPNRKAIIQKTLEHPPFNEILQMHPSLQEPNLAEHIDQWIDGQHGFQTGLQDLINCFISDYLVQKLKGGAS